MQAIQILKPGGPEALTLRDLPTPTPGVGQALVRIEASGVNFIDIYLREGRYPAPLPYTLGQEAAGTIVALGDKTSSSGFKVGDRVAWTHFPGTYAQLAVAPVALLIRKPLWEKLLVCASAIPIALLTNLLRITATGLLHDTVGKEIADAVFHDLAGWLMMPVALALLGLELKLLGRLLIVPPPAAPTLAGAVPVPTLSAVPAEKPASPRRPRRQRSSRTEVAQPFSRG